MRIYTRRGDDGTTDLRAGGRVPKDSLEIELNGTVDEAQAALGLARAECSSGGALDTILLALERDLWVLMAEVATAADRRGELVPGKTAVTAEMVAGVEATIDTVSSTLEIARGFAVPGGGRCSAALDLARTIVRRAERLAVASSAARAGAPTGDGAPPSLVRPYLNRLSDLCWALARSSEDEHLRAVDVRARDSRSTDTATARPVT
ncbi:MAG TPA: cob(I)yrinic acid a,c-diamide adenosyltransferase [Acidimicrobiales bacterium]|nr:cob(I)yrinic acid a,c-diamide adenosyltransferase [Acidimicrobiales bacterium]